MKAVSFSLLFILCSCIVDMDIKNNNFQVDNGLYFGYKGGLFPPLLVFVTMQEDGSIVEFFQPLKGQTIRILTDTLIKSTEDNGFAFIGKETVLILKRNQMLIKPKSEKSKVQFKSISLNLEVDKERELNINRNKAYLFDDFEKTVKLISDSLNTDRNIHFEYEKLQYQFKVNELAENLQHETFLKEYGKIRDMIINEIMSEKPQQ